MNKLMARLWWERGVGAGVGECEEWGGSIEIGGRMEGRRR